MSDFRRSNRMIRNSILFAAVVLIVMWTLIVRPMKEHKEQIEQNTLLTPEEKLRNAKLERKVEMRKASERGDWQRIESLLSVGVPIDEDIGDCTALTTAARYGKTDILRKLLAAGAKTEAKEQFGNTALLYAARYRQNEAIDILLEHGAKLNVQNINRLNAIDLAIIGRHHTTYELLKARKLKVNPLQAITMNDREHLQKLISTGANLNDTYISGDPQAFRTDKSGLVRPSQIKITNFCTPLFGALQLEQWETAEFLIKNGAKVDHPDQYGWTALMLAASYNNKEAVEFLLKHGANVNYRGQGGLTALMNAVTTGNADMVTFLLRHSARMDIKTDDGKSILEINQYSTPDKHREVERILRKAQTATRPAANP